MEDFVIEILSIFNSLELTIEQKQEQLNGYHERDIAVALDTFETNDQRKELLNILGKERFAEVLLYVDDLNKNVEFLNNEDLADLVETLDSDDAIDLLENLDSDRKLIVYQMMDEASRKDAAILLSYDEDEIGSKMTNNFITVYETDSIEIAKKRILEQAEEHDNISTIFVLNKNNEYSGALEMKTIICSKPIESVLNLVIENYPSVLDTAKIDESINELKDYDEELIPVIDKDNHLVGVLTSGDLVEVVSEQQVDDYSKLAGLTKNTDIEEPIRKSILKRIPWLLILLCFDLLVSLLLSRFEAVIATVAIIVSFQPLVLDMAGNSGTQTLAITIRVLSDEEPDRKTLRKLFFKEIRVGLCNGLLLGTIAFLVAFAFTSLTHKPVPGATEFVPSMNIYTWTSIAQISGVVAVSLLIAVFIATAVGSLIPMFFKKIHIDPAVASGPFITSTNDMIAILIYYGLAYAMFLPIFSSVPM